jgi:general secretion pathway protein J
VRARARRSRRGFSLLEVMVAMGIVALVAVLIYGAFSGMSRSRDNMAQVGDRYGQGRSAVSRMARELSSAYISAHIPFQQVQYTRHTAFVGRGDRVDFNAFANVRFRADTHVSDQAEISYFTARNPDGGLDLVRRIDRTLDDKPTEGGVVQVLAENVTGFRLKYLDPLTNEWTDSWDSTQPAAQLGRLPAQIWLTLWVAGGPRDAPIELSTKVPLLIQLPLNFATAQEYQPPTR